MEQRPSSEWIRVPDAHEPLIAKQDFELVQRIRRLDTRTSPKQDTVYLFSGVLICGCCGSRMTRKTNRVKGKEYHYYYCPTGKKHGCANPVMLKESDLVECVKDSLKGYIDNVSCLQAILDGIDQSSINQALANEYASHIAANEQQVEQALEFKARLYESLITGTISKEEYTDYSLRTIKETLESMGVPTATGNQNWSTEAIQRILQNEKYMGDVLLQKTYTADFIEGKVKKNNGELPQYYIKDNHPAIIPREMFYQIQEEIARRKSKKPANAKKAKTNRGRFTSKYALSERLVCGNCGCYFRRVTWSIHGRKQIVWRCINRLECGPKVCKDSPSLKEEELYSAILKAIRSLVQGHQEEMAATLQEALIHCIDGENAPIDSLVIENRLHELDKDLDRLLTMDGSEIVDLRIKQISNEMLQLRQMKKRAELDAQQDMGRENKAKEIMELISTEDLDLTEYSDTLVYRVIERVTVLSKEEIRIRFIGGFEITQPLH